MPIRSKRVFSALIVMLGVTIVGGIFLASQVAHANPAADCLAVSANSDPTQCKQALDSHSVGADFYILGNNWPNSDSQPNSLVTLLTLRIG